MSDGFFIPKKVLDELKRDPDMEIVIRARTGKPEETDDDQCTGTCWCCCNKCL